MDSSNTFEQDGYVGRIAPLIIRHLENRSEGNASVELMELAAALIEHVAFAQATGRHAQETERFLELARGVLSAARCA